MTETMKSLQYQTKAMDVSEKGIVTVGVNGIGIEDYQHDISMPGSFVHTLANDIAKMRWFLNHDYRQLLGVPLSGEEKEDNVIMVGKINLEKQIGRDIFTDYKLYAEAGRTLEHSIGVKAIERDPQDKRKVLQWKMSEYSTLTGWGANPNTYLVGLKDGTGTQTQVKEAADFIKMAMQQHGYSNERLKSFDMQLDLLLKSLSGGAIVTCPHCGTQFDYDGQPEHTFNSEVRDMASNYVRWIAEDCVSEEIGKLRPEIREAVLSVIDAFKGDNASLTEKSITELLTYVRCPHCWARVYRQDALVIPEGADTTGEKSEEKPEDTTEKAAPEETEAKKAQPSLSFWAKLNESIITK